METWKKSYLDNYEVSSLGNVRHIKRKVLLNTNFKSSPYPRVTAFNNGKYGSYLVHRLVAIAFIDNPKNKKFVNHKNGIKIDNRVENLEWVTRQENEYHAFNTGLKNSSGSNNSMSKLDEKKVKYIKEKCTDSKQVHVLAKKFKVHRVTIQRIINGKIWNHVK